MPPAETEPSIEVVEETAAAAVLLKPLRLRLLEMLDPPDSATGLARRLEMPRQKLNYHLRELEKAGFVELAEERRRGNCTERLYRTSARAYLIDPRALGPMAPPEARSATAGALRDRFSWSHLVTLLGRALRDLAALRRRADRAGQRLATFSLETAIRFRSPRELNGFTAELSQEVVRLVAKYQDPTARRARSYQVFLGTYPTLTTQSKNKKEKERRP